MKPSGLNSLELFTSIAWKAMKLASIAALLLVCAYFVIGAFVWRDWVGVLLGFAASFILYFGFKRLRKHVQSRT